MGGRVSCNFSEVCHCKHAYQVLYGIDDHRIAECLGLEGTSVGHPAQPPAEAGSPRAGCTAPRPGGSGISPEKETPQAPWAACARAPSPSEGRSSSSCSAGAASVCARCPLFLLLGSTEKSLAPSRWGSNKMIFCSNRNDVVLKKITFFSSDLTYELTVKSTDLSGKEYIAFFLQCAC